MGYWLGLDVGTTFSAAAVASDGRIEVVGLGHHAAVVPSVLFLREDGSFLVGDAALRRGLSEPGRLARYFKRRFGDSTAILLGGSPWSADALVSQMVRYLVAEVAAQEGQPAEGVAVTHPANWGPFKTDLLAQAVRAAGVESAVLLSEPEAAALQYAWRERVNVGDVVGIYDLGGGTFDAAVLAHGASGFELLGAAEGIERLGGIDFDQAVLAHVSGFLGGELDGLDMNDPATLAGLARLRADCVEAKEALSADTDVSIPVMLPQVQTEIRLTRVEFEAMIRPTLAETTASLARAFRSAGVAPDAVKAVLLVGGSSRIPLVGQLVAAEVGRPVAVDVHPKHVVALGAALAAAGWNGEPGSARIAARSGADGAAAVAVVPALAAQPIAVTALPPGAPSAPAPPDEPPAPAASAPSAAAPSAPAPAPSAPAPSATTPAPSTPVPPTAPIAPADPTAGTYRTGRPPPPSDGSGAAEPPPPVTAPTGPTGPTAPKGGKGTPTRRRLLLIALLAGIVVIAVAVAVVVSQGSGHKTPVRTVTAPASSTTSLVTTGSIAVPGTQAWTDTGIDLKSGQHVIITATGTIEHNNIDPASTVGPDGDPRLELRQYNVLINGVIMAANHGALIAKIGDGDPFLVGQTLDLVVASSGRLSLGVNDAGVANNAGAFQASIKVTGA